MTEIIERSQIHATFTIERSYPVPIGVLARREGGEGASAPD